MPENNDFFELLHSQHEAVLQMMDEMSETTTRATQKRQEMFMKLKTELMSHLEAEEKDFYSILKENRDTREDALEAIEEHHAAVMTMEQLEKTSPEQDEWKARLSVLKEMVQHHIEEEEEKIFSDAEDVIGEEKLDSVMEKFQSDQNQFKSELGKAGSRTTSARSDK